MCMQHAIQTLSYISTIKQIGFIFLDPLFLRFGVFVCFKIVLMCVGKIAIQLKYFLKICDVKNKVITKVWPM